MKRSLLFLFLIILLGCESKKETGTDINKIKSDIQTVQVEKVMEIGGWDAPLEESFFRISDVEVDKLGNIYVADMGNIRIQKFNPEGKLLLSIGKRGQGPGELGMIFTIELDVAGNLYVVDSNNARMQKFSPEGQFIKSLNDPIYDFNDFEIIDEKIFFRHVYMTEYMLFETDTSFSYVKSIIPITSEIKDDFDKVAGNMVAFCVTNDFIFYFFNSMTKKFYRFSYSGNLLNIKSLKCDILEKLIEKEMNRIEENRKIVSKTGSVSNSFTFPVFSNICFFNNSIFAMYNLEIKSSKNGNRKRESFLYELDKECNFLKEYSGFKNSYQTFTLNESSDIFALNFDEAKVIKYTQHFSDIKKEIEDE